MLRAPSTTIRFACEHCRHRHEVPAKLAGRKGRCSACQRTMRVPAGSGSGEAERQVPRARAHAPAREPALFLHTSGTNEHARAYLLVVEPAALRLLEWKGVQPGQGPAERWLQLADRAERDQRVPLTRVREVARGYHGGLDVTFRGQGGDEKLHVGLGDAAERAMAHLATVLPGFRAGERQVPTGEAVGLPAVLGGFTLLLAGIAYPAAAALQSSTVHGRGKAGLVSGIMQAIGPNGVLLLAGLVLLAVALTIAGRLSNPPKVAVLSAAR